MKIIVYIYTNSLLDTVPNQGDLGWEGDKIYEDLGKRNHNTRSPTSLRSRGSELFILISRSLFAFFTCIPHIHDFTQ
ncbi:hypothetical protein BMF77_01377 [Dolichospermum sp. UHCC 0315A]|jgi:hypothetical protein|nr:hypothetical protein BMF77_01377 [Dolichospermum sp. UHCC 0315A]